MPHRAASNAVSDISFAILWVAYQLSVMLRAFVRPAVVSGTHGQYSRRPLDVKRKPSPRGGEIPRTRLTRPARVRTRGAAGGSRRALSPGELSGDAVAGPEQVVFAGAALAFELVPHSVAVGAGMAVGGRATSRLQPARSSAQRPWPTDGYARPASRSCETSNRETRRIVPATVSKKTPHGSRTRAAATGHACRARRWRRPARALRPPGRKSPAAPEKRSGCPGPAPVRTGGACLASWRASSEYR